MTSELATKPMIRCLLAMMLALAANTALASERISEFRGSRSMDTAEFEAQAPWILDWRVSGEFSSSLAVDVALMEAGTGVHLGSVLKTKLTGNGVRLFNQSGKFYFRIHSAMADWILKVEQLSRAEAELYAPISTEQTR
jgi:hypothetical protein